MIEIHVTSAWKLFFERGDGRHQGQSGRWPRVISCAQVLQRIIDGLCRRRASRTLSCMTGIGISF